MESTLTDIRNQLDRGSFKNEEHIRVCVVIRILQELGWNVWSPDEVNLEFAVAPDEDNTKVTSLFALGLLNLSHSLR